MNIVLRGARAAAVSAALAVSLSGLGGLAAGPMATASSVLTATTAVNVRSGPSTSAAILGVVGTGASVTATGPSQGGWTPVSYNGRSGYVSSQYLTQSGSTSAAVVSRGSSGIIRTATALEDVNVRTGPGTQYPVSTVLPKGGTCWLSGATRDGYTQIIDGRWIATAWLKPDITAAVGAAARIPTVTGQVRATAALMIRTTSGSDYTSLGDVPSGTILDVTGVVQNGMAQVIYQGAVRWVNAAYISPVSAAGPGGGSGALPGVTGTRYATTALDIRTESSGGQVITEVPKGTALSITGVQQNGRAQVIYQGAVRWVTAQYLSTSPVVVSTGDSQGLAGLQPKAKVIVSETQARFPMITTYYGVRPDSIPDHPSGRAVDIMLPSYRTNAALGQQIADYYRANASRFGIEYIIFNQRIWSAARASEGWRYMADRGSDTANHMDHVHITVTP